MSDVKWKIDIQHIITIYLPKIITIDGNLTKF